MEYFAIDFETANDNNKIICVRIRKHITKVRSRQRVEPAAVQPVVRTTRHWRVIKE